MWLALNKQGKSRASGPLVTSRSFESDHVTVLEDLIGGRDCLVWGRDKQGKARASGPL